MTFCVQVSGQNLEKLRVDYLNRGIRFGKHIIPHIDPSTLHTSTPHTQEVILSSSRSYVPLNANPVSEHNKVIELNGKVPKRF